MRGVCENVSEGFLTASHRGGARPLRCVYRDGIAGRAESSEVFDLIYFFLYLSSYELLSDGGLRSPLLGDLVLALLQLG